MLIISTVSVSRIVFSVIIIIVLAYILIRYRASKNPADSSLDILKGKLNKGEISVEDYEEAKRRQGKK